eukprot:s331_g5.t1
MRRKDIDYKTAEAQRLDSELTELNSDQESMQTEMGAILEFTKGLEAECLVTPESFAEKQAKRQQEIDGLKEALTALDASAGPALLQRGARALRGHGDLGGGSSLSSDFFGGTENHIWQQLQSERCVLAADGRWLEPPRAFEAPSEVEMKKVIPQELLSEFHDGLCYLHSEFVGLSPATLRQVGVKTHESAFDVLFIVLQRMAEAARLTDVDFLRQSLALAYRLMYGRGAQDLSGMETANGRVRRLRTLRLLPLRRLGAEPAAAADAGLFLPDAAQGVPEELLQCLDLKIVTPVLFDGDEGGLVRRLLMGMGLRGLTPAAVIADGVVPFVKEATAADADAAALCLAFVAKNRSCFPECEEICSRRGRGPRGFDRILRTSLRVPCTLPGSSEISLREVSSGPVVLGAQLHEAVARESSGEVAEAIAMEDPTSMSAEELRAAIEDERRRLEAEEARQALQVETEQARERQRLRRELESIRTVRGRAEIRNDVEVATRQGIDQDRMGHADRVFTLQPSADRPEVAPLQHCVMEATRGERTSCADMVARGEYVWRITGFSWLRDMLEQQRNDNSYHDNSVWSSSFDLGRESFEFAYNPSPRRVLWEEVWEEDFGYEAGPCGSVAIVLKSYSRLVLRYRIYVKAQTGGDKTRSVIHDRPVDSVAYGPDVHWPRGEPPASLGIFGMSYEELLQSEWVEEDTLTVKFELEVRPEGVPQSEPLRPAVELSGSTICHDMQMLLEEGTCSDVRFMVQDEVIQAHSQILCARSEDCDAATLRAFLQFLYTDRVPEVRELMPAGSVAVVSWWSLGGVLGGVLVKSVEFALLLDASWMGMRQQLLDAFPLMTAGRAASAGGSSGFHSSQDSSVGASGLGSPTATVPALPVNITNTRPRGVSLKSIKSTNTVDFMSTMRSSLGEGEASELTNTFHGDSAKLLGCGLNDLTVEEAQKIRNRIRLRLGAISGSTLVTGKSLLDSLTSLGLTTYAEDDMNDMVNRLADFVGLWFEPDVKNNAMYTSHAEGTNKSQRRPSSSTQFRSWEDPNSLGRPRWKWPGSDAEPNSENLRRSVTASIPFADSCPIRTFNMIPAQALIDVLFSDEEEMIKRIFGPRLVNQFKAIQEILLAGDTNRLVAELTFVRINDLAAPPEPMHPLMYIEPLVAILIVGNGVMIGLQTDPQHQDWPGWVYVELGFQIVLFLEILLRMNLLGCQNYWCGSDVYWNLFDLFLGASGLADLLIQFVGGQESDMEATSLLRFCRLIRLVRIVKIFRIRFMKDLRLMVKGLLAGIRTLALAFVLLFAVLYVISGFSAMTIGSHYDAMSLTDGNTLIPYFRTIPDAMFTAFRCFTGECTTYAGEPIHYLLALEFGYPFMFLYVACYMLVTMGIFNVILAVYVDITMKAAKENDAVNAEQYSRESIRVAKTTRELLKKFSAAYRLFNDMDSTKESSSWGARLDLGKTGMFNETEMHKIAITKELFLLIVQDSAVQKLMDELDLPPDRANLFEIIDADGSGTLQITELLHGLLKIRGDLSKSDAVASLLATRAVQQMLADFIVQSKRNMQELYSELQRDLVGLRIGQAGRLSLTASIASSASSGGIGFQQARAFQQKLARQQAEAGDLPLAARKGSPRKATVTFDPAQAPTDSPAATPGLEAATPEPDNQPSQPMALQLAAPCKPSVCEEDGGLPSWSSPSRNDGPEAHSVLAAAARAEGSCAACAGELQKAAGALGLPLQEFAEFLADYCGVTLGRFPVQARSHVLVAGLRDAAPPHLQEAISQLAGDEELRQACITVSDVASPDLELALHSGASDANKLVVASYILELHRNMTATLSISPTKPISAPSSISFHLSSVPWLPCADARRAKPTEARFLWESASGGIRGTLAAELDSKVAVRNFLERNLSIVSERTVSCQEAFRKLLQELGARQLGAEDVLRLLTEWSETGMSESTEGEMTSAYEMVQAEERQRLRRELDKQRKTLAEEQDTNQWRTQYRRDPAEMGQQAAKLNAGFDGETTNCSHRVARGEYIWKITSMSWVRSMLEQEDLNYVQSKIFQVGGQDFEFAYNPDGGMLLWEPGPGPAGSAQHGSLAVLLWEGGRIALRYRIFVKVRGGDFVQWGETSTEVLEDEHGCKAFGPDVHDGRSSAGLQEVLRLVKP